MTQVTFNTTVGGDGSTVSDDNDPTTGLANGGHRLRFVNALKQSVAVASGVVNNATASLNSETAAALSELAAAASAATAGAAASLNLDAISAVISADSIDNVFIYDTSLDDDLGLWRKQTQNLSWYEEQPSSIRGTTKEFPSVAILVTLSLPNIISLYIFDGSDPNLPLWMSFDLSSGENLHAARVTQLTAKNGRIYTVDSNALSVIDFVNDTGYRYGEIGTISIHGKYLGNIQDRNNAKGWSRESKYLIFANAICKDVAVTVLDNAPVDVFGLPVPVIYVATVGGLTRIADDGSVSVWDDDGNTVSRIENLFIYGGAVFFSVDNSDQGKFIDMQSIDVSLINHRYNDTLYNHYSTNKTVLWTNTMTPIHHNSISSFVTDLTTGAIASHRSLTLIKSNPFDWAQGLHATISSVFNSGFQFGDVKGCWLSDTAVETIDDSNSLIVNGDFSIDANWGAHPNMIIGNGTLQINIFDATVNSASQLLTLVVGSTYVFSIEVVAYTLGIIRFQALMLENDPFVDITAAGIYTIRGVCDSPSDDIMITGVQNVGASVDNVEVVLVVADRSYNDDPLLLNGTLQKTAVNQSSELVFFSGFSTANYLSQPYNSRLDFSTNSFCILFWLKFSPNSFPETILNRDSASTAQRFSIHVSVNGNMVFICDDNTTTRTAISSEVVDDDIWHFYRAEYDGSGTLNIYRDGENNIFATATGTALLTLSNNVATLNVGVDAAIANPLVNGSILLLRISAGNLTNHQWEFVFDAEKRLFEAGASCTLSGASSDVLALDYDSVTSLHHVCTSTDLSVFDGLIRVDQENAVYTSISAENALVVKAN